MLKKNYYLFLVSLFLLILISSSICFAQATGLLLKEAEEKFSNEEFEEAKEKAMKVIEANPNMVEGHKIMIESALKLKALPSCLEYYEEKDQSNMIKFWSEERAPAMFGKGYCYLLMNKEAKTTEFFNDCLAQAPNSTFATEIKKISEEQDIPIEIPTRSVAETVKLVAVIAGSLIILIILSMLYNAYKEKKKGEEQAQRIEKDREVDFFGKPRRKGKDRRNRP